MTSLRIALFFVLAALAPSLVCADFAAVPYASLHQVLAPAPALAQLTRLRLVPRVESRDPAVPADSIRLVVQARSGPRELAVARDGSIAFPIDRELLAENPLVSSNQPRGSLRASLSVELEPLAGPVWSYAQLWEGMLEAEQALRRQDPDDAGAAIEGVELHFSSGREARVVIVDRSAEELLLSDAMGRVFIRRDQALLEREARLQLSEEAIRVLPRRSLR